MRMRKKSLNNLRTGLIAGLLLCGWGGMGLAVQAQSLQKVKVYGTVYDISHKQKLLLILLQYRSQVMQWVLQPLKMELMYWIMYL